MALITSSQAPLLLLDDELEVIAASNSFCRAFADPPVGPGRAPARRAGRRANGTCRSSTRCSRPRLAGDAAIDAYEMDLVRKGRRAAPPGRSTPTSSIISTPSKSGSCCPCPTSPTRAHRREAQGRSAAREGDPAAGAPAPGRQQPPDHRQRAHAERPQGAVRGDPRPSSRRAQPGDVDRRRCSGSSRPRGSATSSCGPISRDLCDSIGASMIGDHDQLSLSVDVGRQRGRAPTSRSASA